MLELIPAGATARIGGNARALLKQPDKTGSAISLRPCRGTALPPLQQIGPQYHWYCVSAVVFSISQVDTSRESLAQVNDSARFPDPRTDLPENDAGRLERKPQRALHNARCSRSGYLSEKRVDLRAGGQIVFRSHVGGKLGMVENVVASQRNSNIRFSPTMGRRFERAIS